MNIITMEKYKIEIVFFITYIDMEVLHIHHRKGIHRGSSLLWEEVIMRAVIIVTRNKYLTGMSDDWLKWVVMVLTNAIGDYTLIYIIWSQRA
jgi:hypothetical protein